MLYFKDNLRAKTGTLSDSSAMAGYLTSRSGKTYAFDIMINDYNIKEGEALFIDDGISNLELGSKKGLDVVLLDRKNNKESNYKKITSLDELEV